MNVRQGHAAENHGGNAYTGSAQSTEFLQHEFSQRRRRVDFDDIVVVDTGLAGHDHQLQYTVVLFRCGDLQHIQALLFLLL